MGKIIQIEVPEEVANVIESNPKYSEIIRRKLIETVFEEEFTKGVVSKDVLNYLAKEEDVLLENEDEVIRKLKEKERVKWLY